MNQKLLKFCLHEAGNEAAKGITDGVRIEECEVGKVKQQFSIIWRQFAHAAAAFSPFAFKACCDFVLFVFVRIKQMLGIRVGQSLSASGNVQYDKQINAYGWLKRSTKLQHRTKWFWELSRLCFHLLIHLRWKFLINFETHLNHDDNLSKLSSIFNRKSQTGLIAFP